MLASDSPPPVSPVQFEQPNDPANDVQWFEPSIHPPNDTDWSVSMDGLNERHRSVPLNDSLNGIHRSDRPDDPSNEALRSDWPDGPLNDTHESDPPDDSSNDNHQSDPSVERPNDALAVIPFIYLDHLFFNAFRLSFIIILVL